MEQTDKRKQDKLKFDRVINLARRLPQPAIHDLLRALILPIQADYLLAVGTEGQDARPDMNEREFFFTKIIWAMDYTHMKSLRLAAEDFPQALATAKILPWRIGFVRGGNHSIASGVLAGEGEVIPDTVYDMRYLLDIVSTDGYYWYMSGKICERVSDYRTAAFFEIGRLLTL